MLRIVLLVLLAVPARAQNQNLASPEVHPDKRVTFRVAAPKASDVTFFGDWMKTGTSEKMSRAEDGVWSITLGPLPPSIYLYSFTVDGITMADPVNPRIKLRSRTSASMVEVPAEPPAVWQERDVPHGKVEINWQKSKTLGDTRWIWIYTPPGYTKETKRRYPVLYLLHGSNDTAGGWTLAGQANFILDNLIADKKAPPMIVVMPYTHAVPFGSPREVQATNAARFAEYLFKDVMPLVESEYRMAPGRKNTAIAGLSMGGGESLEIGFHHPDRFSTVAVFSSAGPSDFETKYASTFAKFKSQRPQLWIGCGKDDGVFERSQKLSSMLKANGIEHTYRPTEGAHTYTVWRQYLAELAPLLFR
jgi:enterochelin esterase family protein